MRILITAGPTREHFDSVRFVSNGSSGRMGFALARAARRRGHEVVLVKGPVDLPPPSGVRTIDVVSAADMLAACRREHPRCDAAIFAAAVCDYRPARRAARKPAKRRGGMTLRLIPTPDIAAALGRAKGRRIHLGFALEDHDARAHARTKLENKRFDAIVLNQPTAIGRTDSTIEVLVRGRSWTTHASEKKLQTALRLIRLVERLAAQATPTPRRPTRRRLTSA